RRDENDPAATPLQHPARDLLRQKMWALKIGAKQFIVADLSGVQHVAALPRRNPGTVDQQIQLFVTRLEMRHQRFAIGRGADVALNGLCAGFGSQGLRGLMISAIRRYHSVSFRKLDRNSAPDAATR